MAESSGGGVAGTACGTATVPPEAEVDGAEGAEGAAGESEAAAAPAAVPELSAEQKEQLCKQVAFYFGDDNLPTDTFLLKHVRKGKDGFVPLALVCKFNKTKAILKGAPLAAAAAALREGAPKAVEVDPTGTRVRRVAPMPPVDMLDVRARTVVAENLPPNPTIEWANELFAKAGEVKLVRICQPNASGAARAEQEKAAPGADLVVSWQVHAVVEYADEDAAARAVRELTDKDNWRRGLQVRRIDRGSRGFKQPRAPQQQQQQQQQQPAAEDASAPEAAGDAPAAAPEAAEGEAATSPAPETPADDLGEGPSTRKSKYGKKGKRKDYASWASAGAHRESQKALAAAAAHEASGAPGAPPPPPPDADGPKQPRMPDGTRGFTMGRGKPLRAA